MNRRALGWRGSREGRKSAKTDRSDPPGGLLARPRSERGVGCYGRPRPLFGDHELDSPREASQIVRTTSVRPLGERGRPRDGFPDDLSLPSLTPRLAGDEPPEG